MKIGAIIQSYRKFNRAKAESESTINHVHKTKNNQIFSDRWKMPRLKWLTLLITVNNYYAKLLGLDL